MARNTDVVRIHQAKSCYYINSEKKEYHTYTFLQRDRIGIKNTMDERNPSTPKEVAELGKDFRNPARTEEFLDKIEALNPHQTGADVLSITADIQEASFGMPEEDLETASGIADEALELALGGQDPTEFIEGQLRQNYHGGKEGSMSRLVYLLMLLCVIIVVACTPMANPEPTDAAGFEPTQTVLVADPSPEATNTIDLPTTAPTATVTPEPSLTPEPTETAIPFGEVAGDFDTYSPNERNWWRDWFVGANITFNPPNTGVVFSVESLRFKGHVPYLAEGNYGDATYGEGDAVLPYGLDNFRIFERPNWMTDEACLIVETRDGLRVEPPNIEPGKEDEYVVFWLDESVGETPEEAAEQLYQWDSEALGGAGAFVYVPTEDGGEATPEPTVTPEVEEGPMTLEEFIEMTEDQVPNHEYPQSEYEILINQFVDGSGIEKNYDNSYTLRLSHIETHFGSVQLTNDITMLSWVTARYFLNGIEQVVVVPTWIEKALPGAARTNDLYLTAGAFDGGGFRGSNGWATEEVIRERVSQTFDISNEIISAEFSKAEHANALIPEEQQERIWSELLVSFPMNVEQFAQTGDVSYLPTVSINGEQLHFFLPTNFGAASYNRVPTN